MNERDAMRRLEEANPVKAQDLASLDAPERFTRRPPNRRLVVAIALTAIAGAALAGVFAFNGSDSARGRFARQGLHGLTGADGPTGPAGPTGAVGTAGTAGPTGAGPTGNAGPAGNAGPTGTAGPTGRRDPVPPPRPTTTFDTMGPTGATGPTTSLADAREALGAALVVPDVPSVDPSGIGKIVKDCGESLRSKACDIGISFPAQRVWIYYQPADQWSGSSDPLATYKRSLQYDSLARIVYLSGTPAFIYPKSRGQGLQILIDGVHIRIWVVDPVPSSGPTLQAIAQSIVDRSK